MVSSFCSGKKTQGEPGHTRDAVHRWDQVRMTMYKRCTSPCTVIRSPEFKHFKSGLALGFYPWSYRHPPRVRPLSHHLKNYPELRIQDVKTRGAGILAFGSSRLNTFRSSCNPPFSVHVTRFSTSLKDLELEHVDVHVCVFWYLLLAFLVHKSVSRGTARRYRLL